MDETLTSPQVCALAGCSYRQLNYWCKTGAVRPLVEASGTGSRRAWTRRQAACVWVAARLVEMGCPASKVSAVFASLEADDSMWAGPLLVEHGRGGMVRPIRSVDGMGAGWAVDPRQALEASIPQQLAESVAA